jgi:hypothetical protein
MLVTSWSSKRLYKLVTCENDTCVRTLSQCVAEEDGAVPRSLHTDLGLGDGSDSQAIKGCLAGGLVAKADP